MNKGNKIMNVQGRDTIERFLVSREREFMRAQNGDAALWVATVRRAWSDAFYGVTPTSGNGSKIAPKYIKREAINFLTGEHTWKEHRRHVCDCCDISPEWIKKVTLEAIENGPPQPLPARIYGELDEDRTMRTTNTNWCRIRQLEKKAQKSGNECMAMIREGS